MQSYIYLTYRVKWPLKTISTKIYKEYITLSGT